MAGKTDIHLSLKARKRTYGAVWTGARKLSLGKADVYRLVESWTGETSLSALTDAQLMEIVENFRKMGFERKDDRVVIDLDNDPGQVRKVKVLWLDLHRAGAVDNASVAALNSYVKRMTGIAHVNWLTPADANMVIESLKQWRRRHTQKQK